MLLSFYKNCVLDGEVHKEFSRSDEAAKNRFERERMYLIIVIVSGMRKTSMESLTMLEGQIKSH